MMKRVARALALLVVVGILMSGCATPRQHAQLGQAGAVYAAAVDRLLVVSGNIAVNATSERLLQDDALVNQDLQSYQKLSNVDRERLEIIGRLRLHVRLLANYFALLNELATSDAPQRAQQAAAGVADRLNVLGTQLRGSPLIQNKEVFTSVSSMVVSATIRGELKDELDKRKDVIQLELKTQEELLKVLSSAIQHDLTITNEAREQRLVIGPLISPAPIANPEEWIADRRAVLMSTVTVAQLGSASDAARALREAFEGLISDRLDFQRVNTLVIEMQSLLAVADVTNR